MSKTDSRSSPRFITFEGGEGAGKTTLMDQLERSLHSWGISVVRTREPGGSAFGNQVRSWLLSHSSETKIGSKAELLLFLAARAQHIEEVIAPAIESGKVVFCDRFNDSTVAYQGAGRGLGEEWVRGLCDQVCGKVAPDLTFYLDVDPSVGLSRTKGAVKENAGAGVFDRIEAERLVFHERVRNSFLKMAKVEPNRFYLIDANQPKKVVLHEVLKILGTRFERQ
jgi:dTMP kinase